MNNHHYFCENFIKMIFFPNAKINLGLFVTGKRIDGFHNIETIFYPVPLRDVLEMIPSPDGKFNFSTSGKPVPGKPEDNLLVKAWLMLQHEFGLPQVHIYLHKILPMGAGLGGGSADAAFAIRLINQLFKLGLCNEKMMDYALRLGMDCPFFIKNTPAYAWERGDKMEDVKLQLSGKFLVIVKPSFHVSTAEAYAGIVPAKLGFSLKDVITKPVDKWRNYLKNDFEKIVFRKYPEAETVKRDLCKKGAEYASMSGSGSALYGIFNKEVNLKKHFPNCFYWGGGLT